MFSLLRNKKQFEVVFLVTCLLIFFAAQQAWSQHVPRFERGTNSGEHSGKGLIIDRVTHGGSGCPSGTAQISIAPDHSTFSVLYSMFSLNVPAQGGYQFKNCNLSLRVTPPAGMKLRMVQIDFRGYAHLAAGAEGRMFNRVIRTTRGQPQVMGQRDDSAKGPFDQLFTVSMSSNEGEWSSCDGSPLQLNINSLIQVSNRSNENAIASVDTADLSLNPATIFYLAWSPCRLLSQ